MKQLRLQDVVEFEEFIITEKIAKVRLETEKNLSTRPDDKPTVTYVKNGAKRIIEWVKNADCEWIQRQRVVKRKYFQPTEVVEFIDYRQFDREFPPIEAFVDHGTTQAKDTKFPSDRAIFSECIKTRNGDTLAIYLKDWDPEPVYWKDTNWLMKTTGMNRDKCKRLADAFTALSFNRKTAMSIISDIAELFEEEYVEYLEALAEELPKTPPMHYDPELYYDKGIVDVDAWINQVSEATLAASFPEETIKKLRSLIEKEIETDEEKEPAAEAFGVRRIYHEEDGCSHEFLTFLRFASIKEIKGTMQAFFPMKNSLGYFNRARFWYLTGSQKAQAWIYINARRLELGMLDEESGLQDFSAKK